ncbi:MAG: phosphatidylglycerol lysyltransferase domain-containing protein, partial [Syntrophorhabdales bacterium]
MLYEFPEFKPIGIEDRDLIKGKLWEYQPHTSELNFTNMFIWRSHYGFEWSLYRDSLLVIASNSGNGVQALPPIGPPPRSEASRMLLSWMKDEKNIPDPRIDRADARLASELDPSGDFVIEPTRDHFDYIYRTEDLIQLSGK